jgi:hypothetical protein
MCTTIIELKSEITFLAHGHSSEANLGSAGAANSFGETNLLGFKLISPLQGSTQHREAGPRLGALPVHRGSAGEKGLPL